MRKKPSTFLIDFTRTSKVNIKKYIQIKRKKWGLINIFLQEYFHPTFPLF